MVQTTQTFTNLRAANVARQLEWDAGNQLSLTYRANELAGEVGEACNVAKKIERERLGIRGSRATISDLGDELADVIICADLVAMGEGIDLESAVARKFNATSEKVGLRTRLSVIRTEHAPSEEVFILWMAERYIRQASLTLVQAVSQARVTLREFLTDEGIAFGETSKAWDRRSATYIVDDEMSNWEAD
jgi:NTP pyrophosphatase (non-canonical NTP hydrolase)